MIARVLAVEPVPAVTLDIVRVHFLLRARTGGDTDERESGQQRTVPHRTHRDGGVMMAARPRDRRAALTLGLAAGLEGRSKSPALVLWGKEERISATPPRAACRTDGHDLDPGPMRARAPDAGPATAAAAGAGATDMVVAGEYARGFFLPGEVAGRENDRDLCA